MSDTLRFTDTSTATPEEKARRVLQYLADPKEQRYFYEDGYPRYPDMQADSKAALAVFNSLAADLAAANARIVEYERYIKEAKRGLAASVVKSRELEAENSKLRSALEIVHFKQEPWQ